MEGCIRACTGRSYTVKADLPIWVQDIVFENAYENMYREMEAGPWGVGKWGNSGRRLDRVWEREGEKKAAVLGCKRDCEMVVRVVLEVGPLPAPLKGRLIGEPLGEFGAAFRFTSDLFVLTEEEPEKEIRVTGEERLPNWPTQLRGSIQWMFRPERRGGRKVPTKPLCTSGPHTVFVTFDAPVDEGEEEDGGTPPRMQEATRRAMEIGPTDPVDFIRRLFANFPSHVLNFEDLSADKQEKIQSHPDLGRYMQQVDWPQFLHVDKEEEEVERCREEQGRTWPLAELEEFSGECQAIVRFIRGILTQLGVGRAFGESVSIWYVTADAREPYRPIIKDVPVHCRGPRPQQRYMFVDRPVENRVYRPEEFSSLRISTFEAFLRYRYREGGSAYQAWYSGGAAHLMASGRISNVPQKEEGETVEDQLPTAFTRTLLNAFSALVEYEMIAVGGTFGYRINRHWSY